MNKQVFLELTIEETISKYPFMANYFSDHESTYKKHTISVVDNIANYSEEELEDFAIDVELTISLYYEYFKQTCEFLGIKEEEKVKSLSILPGHNKSLESEEYDELTISQGEIIAIVGPTGSGKSRLLADIEWIADNDTPTGRKILINKEQPDKKWRFSSGNKLVAQLSQNMNFVMDLTVKEFIELHAASRLIEGVDEIVIKILDEANRLAGEAFELDTPITSLSGGQSRALMIADTAILSQSPIVLIDEIENAGIDRKQALKLLIKEEKIVLMATHDPILALMADKRIIIRNGGIDNIINTTENEKAMLSKLEQVDKYLMDKRHQLRQGKILQMEELHVH